MRLLEEMSQVKSGSLSDTERMSNKMRKNGPRQRERNNRSSIHTNRMERKEGKTMDKNQHEPFERMTHVTALDKDAESE